MNIVNENNNALEVNVIVTKLLKRHSLIVVEKNCRIESKPLNIEIV